MDRGEMLDRALARRGPWDLVVVGGGATGAGVALDAAARGYDVLLLERSDFGKGTSSRSTKLIHGGVRYLERGQVGLVREALAERDLLRQNAPHLVHELAFVVPCYRWWEAPYYATGLRVYALLAGRRGFGPSSVLSRDETLAVHPGLRGAGLRGGVVYRDAQFDDTRLLIHLLATAAARGAALVNYAPVIGFTRGGDGAVSGVVVRDEESGHTFRAAAKVVINAAGPFCDEVRRLARPDAAPLITASQGIHLVLDGTFLPGSAAILVPRTRDGRVLFAIPWHGHAVVGTTDTPISEAPVEPRPLDAEIDFVLDTAGRYLERPATRADVRSAFAGVRPLVRSRAASTSALSRDHTIRTDPGGLLTITGGKWTTVRNMAEDCVNQAAARARLPHRDCPTRTLRIHGYDPGANASGHLSAHGADAPRIREIARSDPALAAPLHPGLPYCGAEVVWAARFEMARTVEDVLARRTRALFLDARAAIDMAPGVAGLLGRELRRDVAWQTAQIEAFRDLARGYLVAPAGS
jgi:glycerol-3-phosphate dehydrogenase